MKSDRRFYSILNRAQFSDLMFASCRGVIRRENPKTTSLGFSNWSSIRWDVTEEWQKFLFDMIAHIPHTRAMEEPEESVIT
jgi:hypothetical protein